MRDQDKSKQLLIRELQTMRRRVAELERKEGDRNHAVEGLRDAEAKYRTLVEQIPAITYVAAPGESGTKLYVSPQIEAILGFSLSNLADRPAVWEEQLHPEDGDRVLAQIARSHSTSEPLLIEYRMLSRDGRVIWFHDEAVLVRDSNDSPLFFQGVMFDITERKRAEEDLKRLVTAIEQAAEAIIITDTRGGIEYVNPAFEQITGYTRDEVIGRNPRFLKSGRQTEAFYKQLWDTITGGEVWTGRLVNKKKNGSLFEEEATISPVRDTSGEIVHYVAVTRDITRVVQLERQLLQAQKMEAVGNLAGGIAHDFNNLLTIVLGYAELLIVDKTLPSHALGDLQRIAQAARNGADLVKRLLTFSRKAETNPRPLNLNHQIEQIRNLLSRTIPKMIEIDLSLADELPTIDADPTQIDQIVMNLAVNAADAMPEGGKLAIATAAVDLDAEYYKTHFKVRPGRYVLLTVSDTGYGIDKFALEHIFEPFYTTKEPGKGTGLGLAMVYGIVKQHGGYITCYSEPAIGTTFKIYLPVIEEVGPGPEELLEQAAPLGGTETILLVDDEESIRQLGEKLLSRSGYKVLTAGSGHEALELYRTQREEISLVLLDLIMPGMGGKRCLEELLGIDPELKVLVASGYSANGLIDDVLHCGATCFVSKPYNMRQLLRVVRETLETTERGLTRDERTGPTEN
ncbi:MAG: PAS domain S-box protein [Thermodesulfobacteriota bacterium]